MLSKCHGSSKSHFRPKYHSCKRKRKKEKEKEKAGRSVQLDYSPAISKQNILFCNIELDMYFTADGNIDVKERKTTTFDEQNYERLSGKENYGNHRH